MESYKLYNVVRPTLDFLENLTNWYVRLNRGRMKGDDTNELDQFVALNTLFDVLLNATTLMAPITPFLCEYMYQNLRNGIDSKTDLAKESIHFTQIPDFHKELINEDIEEIVSRMQSAIETGRTIRDEKKCSIKQALSKITLVDSNQQVLEGYKKVEKYIKDELNVMDIEYTTDEDKFLTYTADPDHRLCGQAFKKQFDKKAKEAIT